MVKKKINKKNKSLAISKIKPIPKMTKVEPQPLHFKNLNLNKKIISVILIVLAIGVIGSIFPGEGMTGGAVGDLIIRTFDAGDMVITRIFGRIGVDQNNIFVYEKFVLFLLLFTILSVGLKTLQIKGMQNFVIAGAISLISAWFIPQSVLAMIGLTYSATYASFLLLIPVLIFGFLAWKVVPKSRGGYILKSIAFFVLLFVFAATREGIEAKYGSLDRYTVTTQWFTTFSDVIIWILVIYIIYCLIKAITITPADEQESEIKKSLKESRKKMGMAAAGVIARGVDKSADELGKIFKRIEEK